MLKLEHVKKAYDGVTILDDINLEIEEGEIVSILGSSGCGKTTLLNLILGITDADSGNIIFSGQNITKVPMEKRGFNIVFQDYALFPNLNVYKNIISQYGKPEEIVRTPQNDFVQEFILRQLEIKKNNIYSLFSLPEAVGRTGAMAMVSPGIA